MPRRKAKDSEFHAYDFIKDELRVAGWVVRNPERADAGQVWTQQECLYDPAIKEALGQSYPENIVRISSDTLWVVEAKRYHQDLDAALTQAEGRARAFEGNSRYKVRFITGVAGNPIDSYLVRSKFEVGGAIRSHNLERDRSHRAIGAGYTAWYSRIWQPGRSRPNH